jgi:flagellar protein FlaG
MKRDIGVAPASDPALIAAARPAPGQTTAPPAPAAPPRAAQADLRLVIEENPDGGGFIYKTLDRRTGEVILQLPRADMLKAFSAGDYDPGDLIKTRA